MACKVKSDATMSGTIHLPGIVTGGLARKLSAEKFVRFRIYNLPQRKQHIVYILLKMNDDGTET